MRVVSLADIQPITEDKSAVIEAVRQGFIDHSLGKLSMPSPVQLLFHTDGGVLRGDCHVKCASSESNPYFCIKIASGFYENSNHGLPVNDGLVLLLSSRTGKPQAMFQDRGHLTSIRTAAAGALAVELAAGTQPVRLGIIGTGHQAALQARWICEHVEVSAISVWGRSQRKADALVEHICDLPIFGRTVETTAELCEQSDVIVTATPSTTPLLSNDCIRAGHTIVALGADSPGKAELDPAIFEKATHIITDDHDQCLHHGEFGNAVRAGKVAKTTDMSLGACLESGNPVRKTAKDIVVVDLTGLAAQDLAIATMVWDSLPNC